MENDLKTIIKSNKKQVTICRDNGITIIGERINPTGRNALQAQLKAGKFDMIRREAADQIAAGASILDINAGVPRVDEPSLLVQMIKEIQEATDDIPICIDTSNTKALETALSYYCKDGAKPLVNSVSAETLRIKEVFPLIKQYGAAVIGLCTSDNGVPKNAEERIRNADKIFEEGAKLGISVEEIIIDPVILALGADWKAGKEVLDTISMIVKNFGVNITMGATNASFGLMDRVTLTSYFLAMSAVVGLSCPICDPLKVQQVTALQTADLIMARDPYAKKWIKAFRARQSA